MLSDKRITKSWVCRWLFLIMQAYWLRELSDGVYLQPSRIYRDSKVIVGATLVVLSS